MNKLTLPVFIAGFITLNVTAVLADDDIGPAQRELTQEEIEAHIGRMGEVEKPPEGFEFSDAEKKLWLSDHLSNIKKPGRLYYEFEKTGSYEDGFSDSVFLDILTLNDDGSKNASLDFFSADRKQEVAPQNVTNIRGNPVVGVFMQGDVYEMNRLTEGHWRHFQKMIKVALRNSASVEPTTIEFNGKTLDGEKVVFSPYLDDPHRKDFEKFADKRYEFTFSKQVPGELFQIKTIVPDKNGDGPLIEEKLTLVEASFNN